MIEGVNILNQTDIMVKPDWYLPVVIIFAMVFAICFLFTINEWSIYPMTIGFPAFMALLLVLAYTKDIPSGRYQYSVTIEDSASINEVYDLYTIVEKRGYLYILEDKE
jgi:hypothetical protein